MFPREKAIIGLISIEREREGGTPEVRAPPGATPRLTEDTAAIETTLGAEAPLVTETMPGVRDPAGHGDPSRRGG